MEYTQEIKVQAPSWNNLQQEEITSRKDHVQRYPDAKRAGSSWCQRDLQRHVILLEKTSRVAEEALPQGIQGEI